MNSFKPDDFALLAVVLGAPLAGAFFNGVFGKRVGKNGVRLMSLFAIGVSFAAAIFTFMALRDHRHHVHEEWAKAPEAERGMVEPATRLVWLAWKWMSMATPGSDGRMGIDVKFSVDELSGVMMLIVTGIGFLIHLYSTSYMAKDRSYHRFFAYLNLFIFSMLVLVLADNMVLLFVGWEGVGACSYLLIGFWFDKEANAVAGRKAFIANRIGDVGMIGGMLIIAHYCGALDWAGIATNVERLVLKPGSMGDIPERIILWQRASGPLSLSPATVACLALFLGCCGKSAQIPLYVWLPDAMAGPTPVSALIHAATMVTSGLYLVCRLNFVFVYSPFAMAVIACVGAATALFAATIALVQNDIKKVLAYSTVSQLGFMFLGVGVGAFDLGFFHVLTHAFFKACLFLGAGSVIHAMHARIHDDVKSQDMRMMGGLRKYMPWTYWSMGAATLAIAGMPFTSGFFSKDGILYHAFVNKVINPLTAAPLHVLSLPAEKTSPEAIAVAQNAVFVHWVAPSWLGPLLFCVGILAATMTAFYMFRLLFRTFWGEFRGWAVEPSAALRTNPMENEQELVDDPEVIDPLGSSEHVDTGPHDLADAAHEADPHATHGAHDAGHDEHHEEDLALPAEPPAEAPWTMAVPVAILGGLALVAGFLLAEPLHIEPLHRWLWPVFGKVLQHEDSAHTIAGFVLLKSGAEKLEWPLMLPGVLAFAVGGYLAFSWYVQGDGKVPAKLAADYPGLYRAAYNKWYVDEAYEATIIGGTDALADGAALMDVWVVDGILAKLSALLVSAFGSILRALQTGVVHVYATILAIGMLGLFFFFGAPHPNVSLQKKGDEFIVEAAPGLGYEYKWTLPDSQPEPAFTTGDKATTRTVQVKQGDQKSITLEVKNAFGRTSKRTVQLVNPAPEPVPSSSTMKIPSNPMPGGPPPGLPPGIPPRPKGNP
jgi:NADH-quinone oxidoreductase subunit L